MPVVKPSPTPEPVPTRPPLPLTPTPEGEPPDDLQSLYYVADTDAGPELRAIGMDAQGRRWGESELIIERFPGNLVGLYLSQDDRYLALEFLRDGYGEVSVMERSSGRVWCPFKGPTGCWGGFSGWTPDNQFLFQPFDVPPEGVVPLGVIVVDLKTGQYTPLDLPIQPKWGYSLARNVSLSSDGSSLAYSITYSEKGEDISEIWTMRMDDSSKQIVHRVEGLISMLSWSPINERLIYLYQSPKGTASTDPAELRLLNADGSGERLLAADLPMPGEQRYWPVWSPDGRRVALVQLDDPATVYSYLGLWGNVYVVDTSTGKITRLSAFEERDASYPTWSQDGRFVAFVSSIIVDEQTHYAEVWVASADGSQLYAVSGTAKWYNALAWLPSVSSIEGR
jgi:hypothetical protein